MDSLDYEDREIALYVLRSLTPRQREAFLCELIGLTHEETGYVMGVSRQRASALLKGTKTRLRQNWGLHNCQISGECI